jgi:predicted dehydrogenase
VDKIRIGYVGCGYMAQKVHIPNFHAIPGCELIALAEVRQDLGRQVQARFGIPRLYPDHHAMLSDPDVEAVAVSAAFAVQGQIARDALLAGKHVFMEKPMAVSLEQADAILDASRQAGTRLMVGYMKRYDAGNELVKDRVDAFRASGELGPLTYARNHGFCGNWTAGIDVPMLNLLRWFLGAGDDVQVRVVDLDDDGYTGVTVLDANGTRAVLETGRVSHFRWDEHTQVYFRDGWIKTWAPPLLLKQVPAEVEVYRAGEDQTFTRPIPQPAWSWSYKREAEHFVHCLQTGNPFRSSGEDTRTDVRLFEEIFRAHLVQEGAL